MKTLLIGDVDAYLCEHARSISKDAELITQSNFKKIVESTSGIFYTSLGDFADIGKFTQTLLAADHVIYYPPKKWSDHDTVRSHGFTMESETQEHLYQLSWIKKIQIANMHVDFENINFEQHLQLHPRRGSQAQIWSFGCSVTAGKGVEPNQIYSELLAERLQLDITRVACEGASISWAVDQLLLSDIHENDIIVLGVTSLYRLCYILHAGRFYHMVPRFYENYPLMHHIVDIDHLLSPNTLYQSYSKLVMARNFCDKLRAHLVMLEVIPNSLDTNVLTRHPDMIRCPKKYIDQGTDHLHPGPRQHSWFSQEIYQKIVKNAANLVG